MKENVKNERKLKNLKENVRQFVKMKENERK